MESDAGAVANQAWSLAHNRMSLQGVKNVSLISPASTISVDSSDSIPDPSPIKAASRMLVHFAAWQPTLIVCVRTLEVICWDVQRVIAIEASRHWSLLGRHAAGGTGADNLLVAPHESADGRPPASHQESLAREDSVSPVSLRDTGVKDRLPGTSRYCSICPRRPALERELLAEIDRIGLVLRLIEDMGVAVALAWAVACIWGLCTWNQCVLRRASGSSQWVDAASESDDLTLRSLEPIVVGA